MEGKLHFHSNVLSLERWIIYSEKDQRFQVEIYPLEIFLFQMASLNLTGVWFKCCIPLLLSCWKGKAHFGKDRPGRRLYTESRVKGCATWAIVCTVNYSDSLNLMISCLYWSAFIKLDIFCGTRNIFFPRKLYPWGCINHLFSPLVSSHTW